MKTTKYVLIGLAVLIGLFFLNLGMRGCDKAVEATHLDDAVQNYEEFQSVYNTCQQLNTNLCAKREIPDDDKGFSQISKAQQIAALQANLSRWVNEYNAKSKMWGRALWKSNKLPYELNVNDFGCYDSK